MANFENEDAVRTHLEMHANYPATKQQILDMCNKCSCIGSEADKAALETALPDRMYNDAKDAVKAVLGKKKG